MAFTDDLSVHADQITDRLPHLRGEESTKHALIVPFLQVLGWDVFNPREVQPEFEADFAVKRSGQKEKVDYAVFSNGDPVLLIEAKTAGETLVDHGGQLGRYFNALPSVRIGLITDGVRVRVFGDLRQPNVMDKEPWLDIDLRSLKPAEIDALRKFRKNDFSTDDVISLAEEMVYYNAMVEFIRTHIRDPGEPFIRFVASELPNVGRVTQKLVERLRPIFKKALQAAILEHVARSFDTEEESPATVPVPAAKEPKPEQALEEAATANGVITTEDEIFCFRCIHDWIREMHPDAQIAYRDSKNYFTVHQNNLRKYFLRMNVTDPPFWIAFRNLSSDELTRLAPGFVVASLSIGTRVTLDTVEDLPKLRTAVLAEYQAELSRVGETQGEDVGTVDTEVSGAQTN